METTAYPASWWLLIASVWCAGFTWNAFRPVRRIRELIVGSFFAGWFTSEMPLHHVVWQLIGAIVLIDLGALNGWPGVTGLALALLSWSGLLVLALNGSRSESVFYRVLEEEFGPDPFARLPPEVRRLALEPDPFTRLLLPWNFRDRRVVLHAGIQYAQGAGRRHQLDVHVPITGVKGAPVLFQVHGGGWVVGHKQQQGMPLVTHMAARGWVCVSANYRLSPRATFPDHLVDLKRALAWTREHIAKYGGDPNFIVVTGGSAGGHLCSLLALTGDDPLYQPGFEDVDLRVQGCVPFYGVYDFLNRHGAQKNRGLQLLVNRAVMKTTPKKDPEAFERASPIAQVRADAPPFFVIHGDQDSMAPHEEAREFVKALRAVSRQKVAYVEVPGAQHGFEIAHSVRAGHASSAVFRLLSVLHAEYKAAALAADAAVANDAEPVAST